MATNYINWVLLQLLVPQLTVTNTFIKWAAFLELKLWKYLPQALTVISRTLNEWYEYIDFVGSCAALPACFLWNFRFLAFVKVLLSGQYFVYFVIIVNRIYTTNTGNYNYLFDGCLGAQKFFCSAPHYHAPRTHIKLSRYSICDSYRFFRDSDSDRTGRCGGPCRTCCDASVARERVRINH